MVAIPPSERDPGADRAFLSEILGLLRQRIRRELFDTWFHGFGLGRRADGEVEFTVPNGFIRDWITRNYLSHIEDVAAAAAGAPLRVRIRPAMVDAPASADTLPADVERVVISNAIPSDAGIANPGAIATSGLGSGATVVGRQADGHAAAAATAVVQAVASQQVGTAAPANEQQIASAEESSGSATTSAPAGAGSVATPIARDLQTPAGLESEMRNIASHIQQAFQAVNNAYARAGGSSAAPTRDRWSAADVATSLLHDGKLNDRYTFDEFVIGDCNHLAHAAALAIAQNPGNAYNPLFLHGNAGLGKTHLLQAVCHYIKRSQPATRAVYLSCEDFTNRYITAIQNRSLDAFREYHRSADVLVIDDIEFLAKKEQTQEEFFHTFNALYNVQKQVILSSDREPHEIPTLEERLVSRFQWGLCAQMERPCFETRMAIVKRKARLHGVDLDDPVAAFVAECITTNIRELEGAVNNVVGKAAITTQPITLEFATEVLRGNAPGMVPNKTTLQDVMNLITSEFSISAKDLRGKSRTQAISSPRQIGMYLSRKRTESSLEEIGRFFGNRDHTTVLYAVRKIDERAGKDRIFQELLKRLTARLERGERA